MSFGISGDTYGYYKNGTLVGFKSQADIDAAYQSGYADGQAAGETTHTGTYNITTNGTTDLGEHHTYRYIDTNVTGTITFKLICSGDNYMYIGGSNGGGASPKYFSVAGPFYYWAGSSKVAGTPYQKYAVGSSGFRIDNVGSNPYPVVTFYY